MHLIQQEDDLAGKFGLLHDNLEVFFCISGGVQLPESEICRSGDGARDARLPIPGGPYSIMDESILASTMRRMILFSPTRWLWPMLHRCVQDIRYAKGCFADFLRSFFSPIICYPQEQTFT